MMELSCILIVLCLPTIFSDPTGCTYNTDTVLYTCNARLWALPLGFSSFTNQPQRLLLKDVDGELPASAPNGPTFTGFSAIDTSLFDNRFPASFHIMCYANTNLIIFKDTFQDLGFIDEVIIQDCNILSLPVQVFSYFGEVNSFIIQGGSIDNMVADSFNGLDVKPMPASLTPKGEFVLQNTQIISQNFPFGVFYNIYNVTTLVLDNINITSVTKDTFYSNPYLTNLTISNNNLASLPSLLFASSHSLEFLSLWGMPWICTCSDLWIVPYVINNNIILDGDIICSSPVVQANRKVASYYTAHCLSYDVCQGEAGFASSGTCVKAVDMVTYILTVPIITFTVISLVFLIQLLLYVKRNEQHIREMIEVPNIDTREDKFAKALAAKIAKNEETTENKSYSHNWLGAKRKLMIARALSKQITANQSNEDTKQWTNQSNNPLPEDTKQWNETSQEIYSDNESDLEDYDEDYELQDLSALRGERLTQALEEKILRDLENVPVVSGIWVAAPRGRKPGLEF